MVGAVVGAYFGNPQLGAAIGGFIGGAIDPTKIQGPKLSDGMTVTANDGIPNPWGFGTFSVGCNVIWTADLIEHKNKDDGKGGPVTITYTYTRSFALGICRAIRNQEGTYTDIAGILRVTHNGKVVYNTSSGATYEQLANNSKFLENHKFYLGGETQEPDPTLESYLDPGNAPAFRGQVYMVGTDVDQTDARGSMGTWEFVVSMEAEVEPFVGSLHAGRLSEFDDSYFPLSEEPGNYEYVGYFGGFGGYTGNSVSEVISQVVIDTGRNPSNYLGYSATTSTSNIPTIGLDISEYGVSNAAEQPSVINNLAVVLVYNENIPNVVVDEVFLSDACSLISADQWIQSKRGKVSRRFSSNPGSPYNLDEVCDGTDSVYGLFPLCIRVTRKRVGPKSGIPSGAMAIPDVPGFFINADGTLGYISTYTPIVGVFRILNGPSPDSTVDGRSQYTYYETGPAVEQADPNYNSVGFWDARYAEAQGRNNLPADWSFNGGYPVNVTTVWEADPPDFSLISPAGVVLGTIIAEVCRRCGLDGDDIDVSQLTDGVAGFKVAVETTGESLISSLMPAYFFDCGEWDDKLRFMPRGGDAAFDLNVDDLAESDGPVIEETEAQEVELLRKVHIRAMDPSAGYVETTQTWERRSSTVAADGEQTFPLPVVMDKDTQAQCAEKRGKIAWAELRMFKFTLPYTRPELTATDVGTITDRSGRTQRIRLMEMTEDAGVIQISEASLDRQSAYTSNVEGVTHKPPIDTSPGLIGPTNGWAGNLPSLRTQDNVPGMYIAASGYLSGWSGAVVFVSVDGGDSYQQVATLLEPSRMGVLFAGVGPDDEPIQVFMNSGEISSITDVQLATRGNGWSIKTGEVCEVGQSKTATEDSSGIYELTDNVRGGLGTTAAAHSEGDQFVMLSSTQFLPLDFSLAGQTLIFKFVSFGTTLDDTEEYPSVFNPLFTSVVIDTYTDDSGDVYTDNADNIYYYEATV